jgi:diguanylate cyclase (GGDEF)-like protein
LSRAGAFVTLTAVQLNSEQNDRIARLLAPARERRHLAALAEVEAALAHAEGHEQAVLARCADLLGWYRELLVWNLAAPFAPAVDAIASLEREGLGGHLDWAYAGAGFALAFLGDIETGLAWIDRAVELARSRGDEPMLLRALTNRASVLALVGEYDEALSAYGETLARLGPAPTLERATALQNKAFTLILQARDAGADALLRADAACEALAAATEGLAALEDPDAGRWRAWGLGNQGSAHALLGETARAEQAYVAGLALAASTPRVALEIMTSYAALLLDAERFDEASALIERAHRDAPPDVLDSTVDRIFALRIRLETLGGRAEQALRWSERRFARLDAQFRARLRHVRKLGDSLAELERVRKAEARARAEVERMNERLRLLAGQSQRWMDAALRDPLTGALNRRGLEVASVELFAPGRAVCVAILDLDHFKSINDRFGHATGDEVLVRTVAQLTRTMRQGDLLARTGGEEFCVLFADATAAQSERACDRLVACVRGADWRALGPELSVTISGGIAAREDDEDLASVMRRADAALYRAKSAGRDRIDRWR